MSGLYGLRAMSLLVARVPWPWPGSPRRWPTRSRPTPATAADGRIVFSSVRDGDVELYAVNPDGSALQRLTNAAGKDRYASSPATGAVVFASERGPDATSG